MHFTDIRCRGGNETGISGFPGGLMKKWKQGGMSSRMNLFGASVLVAALAGCTASGPITGGIPDDGGPNGGGGGNDPYTNMRGHIVRYDTYGGATAFSNSVAGTGTANIAFSEDKSTAQIAVSSAIGMPSSGVMKSDSPGYRGADDSFLQFGTSGNYAVAKYQTPYDKNRMAHDYTGYFVGGNRTPPEQIKASATYLGSASGEIVHNRPHGGAYSNGKFEGEWASGIFSGDTRLDLTVGGGNATISGAITDLYVHIYQGVDSGYSNADVPGQITLEQASLSNGAYAGAARLDIPGATTAAGDYQGAMYGKDAVDTAGTFHTRGSIPMQGEGMVDMRIIGAFGASKN